MNAAPAIRMRDLTLGYDRRPAVHHINGVVTQGELLALVGPNGAGKSTLLKGIMGEIKPLGGEIDLLGLNHREIAYLPQQIDIDRSFPISVFDCVAMGLWRRGRSKKSPTHSRRSASATSPIAPSAHSLAASSSARCSRVSCSRIAC
jgi:ABC-type Mn2+/Zn2+ transport system ATPase subunit